ncbi:futalosine hydrolase [Deinococcus radiodurans]|jgi:futalosine nucleosidase|uniref:futalosine hydrolase n=1 Tax=Deinococcus radiodurans TaxID=1299 RepID=UPI0002EDD6B2|nr:futalosine hydrolase [Deinococcus radiodurans]ANC71232.1 futalosine hydrolase [Deinococcus radiodurans R1 = ATCC 13939 = DSM 20539]QIP29641.1 futalosine hydrolase [Deinococcus radiodurans]QIP31674.1 futalosine hydrolase [Deinococcus radiodurans]UID70636.1 futalosine hydrolase [Deinococcus radiodurans R1 = ATCC 13939 = DSM 20539]UTA51070.1 futalosine hydrolase [Deinococcus radiodurans]
MPFSLPRRVLIVVATTAEAERLRDLPAEVVVSGVGPVAAALATAAALQAGSYDLAVSAGIAGAYPGSGLGPGALAVSSDLIQADLGTQDGATWLGLEDLGLSVRPDAAHFGHFAAWKGAADLAQRAGAAFGPMLTLSTVTASATEAVTWETRFPGALTEGMEGAGVAHAALLAGVPALELRGVSNAVGPRDRASWRIGEALAATRRGLEVMLGVGKQ